LGVGEAEEERSMWKKEEEDNTAARGERMVQDGGWSSGMHSKTTQMESLWT